MKRCTKGQPAWIDPTTLYSRQDIADRTGLTDDILGFWIKRRLLVPEGQASGKGVHHKFHFSQVAVAVILKALRDHFGANIGTLKSLSETLQLGVKLFRNTKADPEVWSSATRLADQLNRFRRGEPVKIMLLDPDDNYSAENREAVSETEIVASALHMIDRHVDATTVIRLAETLGADRYTESEIAMVTMGIVLNPRYSSDNYWLLSQRDGRWQIRNDSDEAGSDRSEVGPAMFLPIYQMVRRAWAIPSGLILLDRCVQLQAALDDAGVEAKVVPGDDYYPQVELAHAHDKSKLDGVWNNFFAPAWMKVGDGNALAGLPDRSNYYELYWTPDEHSKAPK